MAIVKMRQIGSATLILGNCYDVMEREFPDNGYDAVVTDSPYGMRNNTDYRRFSGGVKAHGRRADGTGAGHRLQDRAVVSVARCARSRAQAGRRHGVEGLSHARHQADEPPSQGRLDQTPMDQARRRDSRVAFPAPGGRAVRHRRRRFGHAAGADAVLRPDQRGNRRAEEAPCRPADQASRRLTQESITWKR